MSRAGEAIILCGGLGTRLRDQDAGRPKALVPVAGRPFLAWQIEWLHRLGVRRVVLAAGFRADQLDRWVREHDTPTDIVVVTEPEALGTAGAVRHAASHVHGPDAFVTNGDTLLPNLRMGGALATSTESVVMAAVATDGAHTGDRLDLREDPDGDRVVALERRTTDGPAWKNGGFYRVRRDSIATWPADARSLERDVFPWLAARGELLAQRTPPPLLDMGTPDGRSAMDDLLLGGLFSEDSL
ncbi:MAG: NTP transferase domain-containing protein [Acidobacteriota bacterium]